MKLNERKLILKTLMAVMKHQENIRYDIEKSLEKITQLTFKIVEQKGGEEVK